MLALVPGGEDGDGRSQSTVVQQEFAARLTCCRLEYGFLRVRYDQCCAERETGVMRALADLLTTKKNW